MRNHQSNTNLTPQCRLRLLTTSSLILLSSLASLACDSKAQVGDKQEPEPSPNTHADSGVQMHGDASVLVDNPNETTGKDTSGFLNDQDEGVTDGGTNMGTFDKIVVGADGGDGGEVACGLTEVRASQKEVSLLLVLDKSGSMEKSQATATTADAGAPSADAGSPMGPRRWDLLSQATNTTVASLNDSISVGLAVFPLGVNEAITTECTDNCCEMPDGEGSVLVPVARSSQAADSISSALSGLEPGGGTPTAVALGAAMDYFESGSGQDAPGERYVLLITDGGPTCNADLMCEADSCTTNLDGDCPAAIDNCCDPMFGGDVAQQRCLDTEGPLAQIQMLQAANIQTVVMGIAGSEAYAAQLNQYATAGGLPNEQGDTAYYAVEEAGGLEALTAALESITQQLVQSCTLQLDEAPPDINKLNVRIDGELLPQAGDNGWELDTTEDPPSVVIKGETCTQIEEQGAETVAIVFGCPTLVRAPK